MSQLNELLSQISQRANQATGNFGGFAKQAKQDVPRLVKALQKAIEQRNGALRNLSQFTYPATDGSVVIASDDAELARILSGEGE